jgi:hypothetical protein
MQSDQVVEEILIKSDRCFWTSEDVGPIERRRGSPSRKPKKPLLKEKEVCLSARGPLSTMKVENV